MKVCKEDVAVVVPTRNSCATLRLCLESIRGQSQPCLLVVVDNGSTDGTLAIAHEYADLVLMCGPERSAQRNAGAAAVSARYLGFIDSDMELPSTVVEEAVEAIDSGAMSVVVPERTVGEGFWAEVRAFERSFYQGSDTIEAPRFFCREVFDAVQGFDEAMTGAEDWDLGLRVRELGPMDRIEAVILHHEGRVKYFAACRKKGYYGPGVLLFLAKYRSSGLMGVTQREWLHHPRRLCSVLGFGLLVLKAGEAFAIVVAVIDNKRRRGRKA
ncbi:glycosyltransferase [Ferrimicrobium sp.]|uniref:glycosyltransferase family 2 protein n=1 Tax=Ferrimicrobium sp. TaxID=2926050 RepID=UPI0026111E8B|nr:glycosyltransferase [Ferrimicrobium sp.]